MDTKKLAIVGLALLALLALAKPTVTVTPPAVAPGWVVTISVTGGQAGEECGIEIENPSGNKVFEKEITLSPAGAGSASWQIPTAAGLGTYTVYVSCEDSGAADPVSFRVTALVGGEARKDLSPFLLTALAVLAAALIALSFVKKF
ncbi:MAG: MG2 domain-containing protein [Thermofilaceae archaeon]